jgi:hypothetical protein
MQQKKQTGRVKAMMITYPTEVERFYSGITYQIKNGTIWSDDIRDFNIDATKKKEITELIKQKRIRIMHHGKQ